MKPRRLLDIVLAFDTEPVEVLLACTALLRGGWLWGADPSSLGAVSATAMEALTPRQWAAMLLIGGALWLSALHWQWRWARVAVSASVFGFWLHLAWAFWLVAPHATAVSVNLALSVGAAWVFCRLCSRRCSDR